MLENLFKVSDEIVIITGIEGQLGFQYAHTLLENQSKVIGIDLKESVNSKNLNKRYKDKYSFVQADVTDKISLKNALKLILKIGIPTVLINNAAIDSPPSATSDENGPFESYPEASWNKIMDVNLTGVFLCCQVFGEVMAKAKKGSIINISSIYGVVAPDQSLYEYKRKKGEIFFKPVAYSASKSGILNLTRYLAVYWAQKNVRINSLSIAGVFNNQEKGFINSYCKRIPIGRMANADEYNGCIIFLASNASKYMTGHNMIVDGGWTAI